MTPAPNFSATVVYAWYCVDPEASDEPSGRPSRIDIAGTASSAEHGDAEQNASDRPTGRHRADWLRDGRGRLRRERGALATVEDALAHEAEHRRREGHRDEHGDGHAGRADGAHHAQEGDPGHVEPEQRDEDGHPGEDDGVPGGARREADGFAEAVALLELPAVPIDDEQRVVDADREPEHDAEHGGHRHHLDDARQRQRGEDADAHADERAQDREPGADEGAEHGDQDDRRDDEADQFAAAEDGRDARGDLRREVDLDARGRLRAERILDGGLRRRSDVELRLGEHDGCHGGTAVLRHESDPGRHLEQGRSELELAALCIELRLALVEFCLLGGQAGFGLVERSGRLGLRARGVELGLTLVELS